VQLPLLRAPPENLSWYSVVNIFHKVIIAIKHRLNGDAVYQNLLILNQDCWSYFNMSQGSGFFLRHSVDVKLRKDGAMHAMITTEKRHVFLCKLMTITAMQHTVIVADVRIQQVMFKLLV